MLFLIDDDERPYGRTVTKRPSCSYGGRCYRKNYQHKEDEAHPGDYDYESPAPPSEHVSITILFISFLKSVIKLKTALQHDLWKYSIDIYFF